MRVGWRSLGWSLLAAAPASGQATAQEAAKEVVVTADRRSAAANVDPLATLDAGAIAATGATTIGELLRSIRSVTQSADGSDPIFLLNAQRVSGYPDIATLPPEAIEKVEVLPEPVALRYGYPPTRRVLNFITRRHFRQVEVKGVAGATTRGLRGTGAAYTGLTRLRNDARLTMGLEVRHTDAVRLSDRAILPDPDILYDALGNVTGIAADIRGGEIDPALSAAAGQVVTVAPVPDGARTLAGFAGGANRPRVYDLGPYRTLVPENDAIKADLVVADRIGAALAGSFTLSAERSRDRNLAGPATAALTVPGPGAGGGASPFVGPVLLYRYLTEVDPLRQGQTKTTLHAGGMIRGAVAGWRWDATAALDQQLTAGFSERGVALFRAQAAITAGADPFAPLDPALLGTRLIDRGRQRTRVGSAKAVVTGTPLRLPAGDTTLTATVEGERAQADSSSQGSSPSRLGIGRTRIEGAVALDLPLASRREDVLPFLGELSVNAAGAVRRVGGSGTLGDTSYGVTWGLLKGVQLVALSRHAEAAPPLDLLSTPPVQIANVPVFDFGTGRTALATALLGGNPDLRPERRDVRSVQVSVKPFERELRLSATYEATTIRDATGVVYALTPRTEAILPELYVRDAAGRLLSVTFRPINFQRQRQRTLTATVSANGQLGRALPPGPDDRPPERASYYAGIGPTVKFSDRLQLRAGAPELDILRGETITGSGAARVFGYAYGGINYRGNGLTFDGWYSAASRVQGADPVTTLRFLPILRLNLGATIAVHPLLRQDWTRHLQVKLDLTNVTDARPRVVDATGAVPNRFQQDYLDPTGRTIRLTLRKLF